MSAPISSPCSARKPALGRVFLASEVEDTTQTIVIFRRVLEAPLQRRPHLLDRMLHVAGVASTIVGVMPPEFGSYYGDRLDLWLPVEPRSTSRGFAPPPPDTM